MTELSAGPSIDPDRKNSVTPAQAGVQASSDWIPICIGMTESLLAYQHRETGIAPTSVTPAQAGAQASSDYRRSPLDYFAPATAHCPLLAANEYRHASSIHH
jgi:hypothetical protein